MIRAAIVLALTALLAALPAGAQTLFAPDSAGHLVPVDSLTSSYVVSGVRVIQRQSHASDIVAVDLILLGGTQQLTPATQGIERLALDAASYGTRRYPGATAHRAVRHTGSVIYTISEADWTVFGFEGLADQFDSTFAAIADRVVAPTLDSAAVAVARATLRVEARRRLEQPDAWVRHLADSVAFAGHPYALDPDGTPESLDQITTADVRRYAAEQFVTSRMLLVVVGPVSRAQVERAVSATLGTLPHGAYVWAPPPPIPTHKGAALAVVAHQASTNYLLGFFGGPPVTSSDYPAFAVATELLGGELSTDVREKRALSYAAYAPYLARAVAVGGLYASTLWPDQVLPVMREEIQQMETSDMPNWWVGDYENQFITGFYYGNETNGDQAGQLARAAILDGDYRQAGHSLDRIRKVSSYDVHRMVHRYMHNIQMVYFGDPARLGKVKLDGF